MKYGIMQGRLSPKEPHLLQSFPWDSWEDEFQRAKDIGFSSIEWLFDKPNWDSNPILTSNGRLRILQLIEKLNINVSTLCAHYFIDGELISEDIPIRKKALDTLELLSNSAKKIGVKNIILPFFDKGSLTPFETSFLFENILCDIVEIANKEEVNILIESELTSSKLLEILNLIKTNNVGLCYDIGNAASLGFDVLAEIKELYPYIFEIHIKDRKIDGGSVMLGEGDTPVKDVIKLIHDLDFNKPVILETPVGTNWELTAQRHFSYL